MKHESDDTLRKQAHCQQRSSHSLDKRLSRAQLPGPLPPLCREHPQAHEDLHTAHKEAKHSS